MSTNNIRRAIHSNSASLPNQKGVFTELWRADRAAFFQPMAVNLAHELVASCSSTDQSVLRYSAMLVLSLVMGSHPAI